MGAESLWHWIIVVAVVFLLFGKGKVSELMGDAARGIKAFKRAMADDDEPTNTDRERHAEHESQSRSQ
jgi:sec-independent protein translocase protein TatA